MRHSEPRTQHANATQTNKKMSPTSTTPSSPTTTPSRTKLTWTTSEAKEEADEDHLTASTQEESTSTSTSFSPSPSQSSVSLDEMMVAPNDDGAGTNGGEDDATAAVDDHAERVPLAVEATIGATGDEPVDGGDGGDRIRDDAAVVVEGEEDEAEQELILAAMARADSNSDTVRVANTGAAATTRAEDLFKTSDVGAEDVVVVEGEGAAAADLQEDAAAEAPGKECCDGSFTSLVEGANDGDSDGMLLVDAVEEDRRVGSVVLSRRGAGNGNGGGKGGAVDGGPPALPAMDRSTHHLNDDADDMVPSEVITDDRVAVGSPLRWTARKPSPGGIGTDGCTPLLSSSLAGLAGDTNGVHNSRNPDSEGSDRDVCASPEIMHGGATCSPSRFSRASSTAGTISTYDTAVDVVTPLSTTVSAEHHRMMSPASFGTAAEHPMMSPASAGTTRSTPSPPPPPTGNGPFPEKSHVGAAAPGGVGFGVIGGMVGGSGSPPATYHNSISHLPTPVPVPEGGGGPIANGVGVDADQIAARFHQHGLPHPHPYPHQQQQQQQQHQLSFQIPTASAMDVLTQHLLNSMGQQHQNQQQQRALSSGYATPIGGGVGVPIQAAAAAPHPAVNGGAPTFAASSPAPAAGVVAFSRSNSGVAGAVGGKRSIRLRLVEEKEVGDGATKKKTSHIVDGVFRRNFRRNRAQSMGTFTFKKMMNSGSGGGGGDASAPAAPETPNRTRETERGSIAVSWYDGTTTCELQEHVRNSIVRKLGSQEVDCVRLLDEDVEPGQVVEVVLSPHIPDGSRFLVKFKIPPPTPVKTVYKYGDRAPDSPSAAPSPCPSNPELNNMAALSLTEEDRIGDGPVPSEGGGSPRRLLSPSMLPTVPSINEQEVTKPCVGGGLNKRRGRFDRSSSDPDHHTREKVVVVKASRSQEKKHVVFVIANYFVLFISLIVISAEIHDRAPRWLEEQMGRVNSCAVDRDTLFDCVSNGDVSGLVATFFLWVTRNTATTRFFLFGFESRQQLWTVVYEALVTAVCWGTSYMFIRRGLNPDTRTDFLSRYWKDAMYGSLAGFNAYFMKAVLKNLIPKEVLGDVLETRQLRIIDWLAKALHPAAPPSKL